MEVASQQLRFEDAAKFRDQIQAIRRVQEQQYVSEDSMDDMDVLVLPKKRHCLYPYLDDSSG